MNARLTHPSRLAIIGEMHQTATSTAASRRGPARWLLERLSSIWTGIGLLIAIIVYSALGSAIPPLRQFFELTELAYFHHWVFGALIVAFCFVLICATIRRIRFNAVNAGVLTVHTGLLLLSGGSLLYFGGKIEGDVMLEAPQVLVISKARLGSGEPPVIARIAAVPGKTWSANMPMAGGQYDAVIKSVRHDGINTAAEVTLELTSGSPAQARTISLRRSGDTPPRADVNDKLLLALVGATKIDHFYLSDLMAMRFKANGREVTFEVPELPRYYERLLPGGDDVLDKRGRPVQGDRNTSIALLDNWRLPIRLTNEANPESRDWPIDAEIDGYLPYADLEEDAVAGGDTLNPVAKVEVTVNGHPVRALLSGMAAASGRETIGDVAAVEFRWLEKPEIPPEWRQSLSGRHVLTVEVKDKGIHRQFDVTDGQEIAIEGTDYRLKVDHLLSDWPLMTPGFERARSPVAQVAVTTPTKKYQRTVVQRYPQLSQDIDEKGTRHRDGPYDANLVLTYHDCTMHNFIVAAAAEMPPVLVHTAPGGARHVQPMVAGQPFSAAEEVSFSLRELIERPALVGRPVVVPFENRQRNIGRLMSLVRVHLWSKDGKWTRRVWVPFTQFDHVAEQRRPQTVDVPNWGPVEIVYGRATRALPGTVTLEQMAVDFNPGRGSVKDWKSHVRVEYAGTKQVGAGMVWLNHTLKFGEWTLFQSTAAPDHASWTGLGVGNRIGIFPMTLGCVFITMGLLYAFYVKPVVKRWRKERIAMQANESGGNGEKIVVRPALQGVGVVSLLIVVGMTMLQPTTALAQSSDGTTQAVPDETRIPTHTMPDDDVHRGVGTSSPAQPGAEQTAEDHVTSQEMARIRADRGADAVRTLKEIAPKLKLDEFRLLLAQYEGRYVTVEAWARDIVRTIHGTTDFEGLDPVVAALELTLNAKPHVDRNVIYLKDIAIRHDLTSHPVQLDPTEQQRIRAKGYVSYRFLMDDAVQRVLDDLKSKVMLKHATDRVDGSIFYFERASRLLDIVPDAATDHTDAPWHTVDELAGNIDLPAHLSTNVGPPVPGVAKEDAKRLLLAYMKLVDAWRERNADAINENLSVLSERLPSLAKPGVYLSRDKRVVEAFYYRMNAFTWGWGIYLLALVACVFAVCTGFRFAYIAGVATFLTAFVLHGAGLALRWYILGRIPVANMFESVVASAWLGAAIALALEWRLLRAWQSIYLAPMVAAVILNQRYADSAWHGLWIALAVVAGAGLLADMIYSRVKRQGAIATDSQRRGIYLLAACFLGFLSLALGEKVGSDITTIAGILDDVLLRIHTVLIITSYSLVTLAFGVANSYLVVRAWKFGSPVARITLGCEIGAALGVTLMLGNAYGHTAAEWVAVSSVVAWTMLAGVVAWAVPLMFSASARMQMAGGPGAFGLMSGAAAAPAARVDSTLLDGLDKSQMVLMNMANIGLFVGLVLGAVWADYSWGRPWGWDPKEVFAMTTWLIYAILIHVRFVTRERGLWSAVVAVIGFAMMMFNWWAVNFYIVGLHSYA